LISSGGGGGKRGDVTLQSSGLYSNLKKENIKGGRWVFPWIC